MLPAVQIALLKALLWALVSWGPCSIGTFFKVTLPDISSWDVAEPLWWGDVVLSADEAGAGLLNRDQQLGTAMSLRHLPSNNAQAAYDSCTKMLAEGAPRSWQRIRLTWLSARRSRADGCARQISIPAQRGCV